MVIPQDVETTPKINKPTPVDTIFLILEKLRDNGAVEKALHDPSTSSG